MNATITPLRPAAGDQDLVHQPARDPQVAIVELATEIGTVLDAQPAVTVLAVNAIMTRLAHGLNPIHEYTSTWNEVLLLNQLQADAITARAQTMTALARGIGLSRAAMTTCTDRLEAQGLVRRAFDPTDRRRLLVHITQGGAELVLQAITFDTHTADLALEEAKRAARASS